MRDIIPDLNRWLKNSEQIALATVVKTWGSAPRKVGAHMAITTAGEITGSVSGGCVEGAVIEAALEVLKSDQSQLLHFGISDEESWEVGLACGGEIDVFVQSLDVSLYRQMAQRLADQQPLTYTTIITGESPGVTEILPELPANRHPHQTAQDETTTFTNVIMPSPQLVIIGGVQIAIALAKFAQSLDFKTILIDPRKTFATPERFPEIDRIIQSWPDEALTELGINAGTAIAVLTHDPKLDDPALITALNSDAFYVGALGSSRTQKKRNTRLAEVGLTPAQIERIHGPIGLSIGADTPEEIALSIIGEIVQVYRG